MNIGGAVAGGVAGTVVLTTVLRGGSELRLTRMDLPFLLGTAVTSDRRRAKLIGYLAHFAVGIAFALVYYGLFAAIGRAGWWLGAAFGAVHGLITSTALVNIVLPAVHPRMGSPFTAADASPLLEPPGFLLRNYGRSTALLTVGAHVLYGTLVGGFIALSR